MTFHILRIPEKTDGLPHPRRDRCPHRPAAPVPADLHASGSEKRSRGNTATPPTRPAPSATGRQSQESQKGVACPKAQQNRSRHRSADSRQRGGTKVPERDNAFLFGPCTARFSFGKTKEKWGVHPVWTMPPCGSRNPPESGCLLRSASPRPGSADIASIL